MGKIKKNVNLNVKKKNIKRVRFEKVVNTILV